MTATKRKNVRLTSQQETEIKLAYAAGATGLDLAARYGCSSSSIYRLTAEITRARREAPQREVDVDAAPPNTRSTRWEDSAACRDEDRETFFPSRGDYDQIARALSFCRGCTVKAACLDFATRTASVGVWGGHTIDLQANGSRRLVEDAA